MPDGSNDAALKHGVLDLTNIEETLEADPDSPNSPRMHQCTTVSVQPVWVGVHHQSNGPLQFILWCKNSGVVIANRLTHWTEDQECTEQESVARWVSNPEPKPVRRRHVWLSLSFCPHIILAR